MFTFVVVHCTLQVVVKRRDEYMSDALRKLCTAKGLGRTLQFGLGVSPLRAPPARVLAVVGRSHVLGMRERLIRS